MGDETLMIYLHDETLIILITSIEQMQAPYLAYSTLAFGIIELALKGAASGDCCPGFSYRRNLGTPFLG